MTESMVWRRTTMRVLTGLAAFCLLGNVLSLNTVAQAAKPDEHTATLSGTAIKDPGGEPVKKVIIELIGESHGQGANYTSIAGVDGTFQISGIQPGTYRLYVEKTGYFEIEKNRPRHGGRMLTLSAGQEMKEVAVHMQAAAVVHGRVTDEDGDPMPGAEVSLLSQTYESGHQKWEPSGSEHANDLGEYRISGIAAGSYYVVVTPPPNFRSMFEASGTASSHAPDKPEMSYRTTYYPSALDRQQATPVEFHAGDEVPMDFSLVPQPSVKLRGQVAGIPPGASVAVMLQAGDMSQVFSGTEVHKDGTFDLPDIAPGEYLLIASATGSPVRLMAKQNIHVAATTLEGLRLTLQPGSIVRGRLGLEAAPGKSALLSQFSVALVEGDGEGGMTGMDNGYSTFAQVLSDGTFEWKDVAPGHYYPLLVNRTGGEDWFLRSAISGGRDLSDNGFSVSGSAMVMYLVASSRSASVTGFVKDHEGKPVTNATVVAVPAEQYRKRSDRFGNTASDQTGHFILPGLRPGSYTLFAWESLDGDQYFDPEFLKKASAHGKPVTLSESERSKIELEVVPDSPEQP